MDPQAQRKAAIRFIVCLGVVSLFADMTYEGAHSIIGPRLKELGATATEVGIIAGFGEMLAASLRLSSLPPSPANRRRPAGPRTLARNGAWWIRRSSRAVPFTAVSAARCRTAIKSWPQGEGARMAYWCPGCQAGEEPLGA